MATGTKWHPLPVFPGLPVLMISPHFESSSYTLHVTDLANVWVESLDRKGILLRSLQEDTSIDLSLGDPTQWTEFLSKLNAAFDPTSKGYDKTSLSIAASSSDSLILHVTYVLPKGFQPLKWPIHLTKCPPAGLASELVLPLIQAQHVRTLEIEDLVTRLKEKDAVIAKLVDKLDAMGIGLDKVFNALSGKRKVNREMAGDKVKGLAVFDEGNWSSALSANQEPPQDVSSLVHMAFPKSGLPGVHAKNNASAQLNDWWTKIGSSPKAAIRPQMETSKESQDAPSHNTKTAGERDDDDFQVQATPPHIQSRRQQQSNTQTADDTTDDDDSLAIIPDSLPAPSPDKPRPRIGALGGKRANQENSASQSSRTIPADEDETQSESEPELAQPKFRNLPDSPLGTIRKPKEASPPPADSSLVPPPNDDDDETASSSDSDNNKGVTFEARPSAAAQPTLAQRNKVGLGRIGGKSNLRATPEPPGAQNMTTTIEVESPKAATSPAKPAGRKIGTIGHKAGADGKRYRPESSAEAAEPETEEQKAERRRAEIARDLERKATAPTKKKRRF
ncbi:XLF-domain-containing protein [Hypoxylon fragiforme]|uniref:XLF-domain-containing protein n=1 Tax=Hypoxylon fragiforme TaxID=63214 RepID=UPI0020C65B9A|nr:XLF-domain-containing protein [Hypoxylon fragiforme]KAI2604421.1 XLF-domain-containing protein [Hypoxylon fragiforme]